MCGMCQPKTPTLDCVLVRVKAWSLHIVPHTLCTYFSIILPIRYQPPTFIIKHKVISICEYFTPIILSSLLNSLIDVHKALNIP